MADMIMYNFKFEVPEYLNNEDNESSDLDDIDEETLAQLDPEELEQLEAWSGKYL